MKRSRVLWTFTAFVVVGQWVFASGTKEQAPSQKQAAVEKSVVLKFAHTDPPTGTRQQAAEYFAQKVKEYTNGRYAIQIFPSGQLGNDTKLLDLEKLGTVDFVVTGAAIYGKHEPSMSLTLLPYLVETLKQGWHLYDDSAWVQQRFQMLGDQGFKMLATWEAGFRVLTTRKPVSSPADVRGMKLRVPPNPIHLEIWTNFGANPVSMGINEVYLAIQQGVVDGQENPIPTVSAQKFYEVAPYVTLTNHVYGPIPLSMSMKSWQKLSSQDQQAVLRAAKEASTYSRNLVVSEEDAMLGEMKSHGATITKPDLRPWSEAVQPVYAWARKEFGAAVVDPLIKDAEQIKTKYPEN